MKKIDEKSMEKPTEEFYEILGHKIKKMVKQHAENK
ncbi:hypothetical protein MBFIL_02350 [Methanobrevibacter filiformis]|uniref:Uncharacterized protein n=1 Tax=Methanobrevibacter filiformis TaxID=55758 RepID=A0A166F516_9EURY|nr:hypothetical protein MBFIL_02350 [Methanobrevibacter filiformis]